MTRALLVEAIWLLLDVVAWAVLAVTVVRVIRLDRHRLAHGGWSKLGWLTVTVLVTWPLGPITVPVGAVVTLACTRTRTDRQRTSSIDLAEGIPPGGP